MKHMCVNHSLPHGVLYRTFYYSKNSQLVGLFPVHWRANITSGIRRQLFLDRDSVVPSTVRAGFHSPTSPQSWESCRCQHVEQLPHFNDGMPLLSFPRLATWGPQTTRGSHSRTASAQSAWRTS